MDSHLYGSFASRNGLTVFTSMVEMETLSKLPSGHPLLEGVMGD